MIPTILKSGPSMRKGRFHNGGPIAYGRDAKMRNPYIRVQYAVAYANLFVFFSKNGIHIELPIPNGYERGEHTMMRM